MVFKYSGTAPSKDVVQKLCRDSFPRSSIGSGQLTDSVSSSLSITTEEAAQVVQALHTLTQHVVYKGLTTAEQILSVFPGDFHQNLKNLLTKIILDNVSAWRNEAQNTSIALPRLVDLDWRVDIKTASDFMTRMAVPTCLLQMKIQEDPDLCGLDPPTSTLTMELSKETLDTMLDGLGRIRDQLSAVASK
ncbi:PREDICTED: COMM domain-containing protein 9 isoform X2 [Nanorana parkeri]|uniref:COMM domain-containing protein 9 isoform X2 n=1 Tax=Nanorana parkeri TaxID=125878 RepID=UPI00085464C5|nr:PREDICTED: COMM domain-containing protein 9 isoform X2 [Nanorana parkeri]